jgi:hypothetical protein
MLQPFTREDTHTLSSIADYSSLTSRTSELPKTLDDLLDLLENKDPACFPDRNQALAALVRSLQDMVAESTSI